MLTRVLGRATAIFLLGAGALFGAPQPQTAGTQGQGSATESERVNDNKIAQPEHRPNREDQEPTFTSQRPLKDFAKDFALDQKDIWISPTHLRVSDTQWLLPLSGF